MCRYSSAFHFYTTLTGLLSAPLIRYQVVEVCKPRDKRLLAPAWMMGSFHRD